MTDVETLEIVVDAIDSFSDELNRLLLKLGEVKTAAEAVDDITIDVDVRGNNELAQLNAHLAALNAQDLTQEGGGNILLGGDKRVDRSRRGGGRSISREADEALRGLTSSLSDISRQIGEVGDLMEESLEGAAQSASGVSEEMAETKGAFRNFRLNMSDIHNAMARLVPLLLLVIGAMPALIGALGVLATGALAAAAALAGITAFGALGAAAIAGDGDISEGFMEILRQIQSDFLDAFMPLAERLAPLFQDALDGLGRLFQDIANQGDALVNFANAARDFGGFIADSFPTFLADIGKFASAMAPLFGMMADFVGQFDLFEAMAGFMADAAGPTFALGEALFNLLPAILNVSLGFLKVLGGITKLISFFVGLVSILPISGELFGMITGGILAMATAILIANSSLLTLIAQGLIGVISYLGNATAAFLAAGIMEGFMATATSVLTSALYGLATAVGVLLAISGLGLLVSLLGSVGMAALGTSNKIDKATKSLENFKSAQEGMGTDFPEMEQDITAAALRRMSGRSGRVNISIEDNRNPDSNGTQDDLAMMNKTV